MITLLRILLGSVPLITRHRTKSRRSCKIGLEAPEGFLTPQARVALEFGPYAEAIGFAMST